jgi:hypothetical protein
MKLDELLVVHPEIADYPIVLADGRYNIKAYEDWLRDRSVIPGPPSGRDRLRLGEATGPDLLAYVAALERFARQMCAEHN